MCVYLIKLLPKHKNNNTRFWLSARAKTSLLLRGKPFSNFLLLKLLIEQFQTLDPWLEYPPSTSQFFSSFCFLGTSSLWHFNLLLPTLCSSQLLIDLVALSLEETPFYKSLFLWWSLPYTWPNELFFQRVGADLISLSCNPRFLHV